MTLLKICGLRSPEQAAAVAALGVEAIGVIGVPTSPRHVAPEARGELFAAVAARWPCCRRVLVLADPRDGEIDALPSGDDAPTVLQLHGEESPGRCREVRDRWTAGGTVWKALRIRSPEGLERALSYAGAVDGLLLDAWVPHQLGGTGHRIPLEWLAEFHAPLPWWLAGGIRPENAAEVLAAVAPTGLDASSGVEVSPGIKDLGRVATLLEVVRSQPLRW